MELELYDLKNNNMPNRTDVLNHLARKHSLEKYLEIGVQDVRQNFENIVCTLKLGVDPNYSYVSHEGNDVVLMMTSDEFFENPPHSLAFDWISEFDLIFIDGLHTAEQVRKDFENALKILSPKGFIVMHDCNPEKEEHTIVPRPTPTGHWNGDVYRFASCLGYGHDCFFTVDIDNGCGVWRNCNEQYVPNEFLTEIKWEWFAKNRERCLNLTPWNEFIAL